MKHTIFLVGLVISIVSCEDIIGVEDISEDNVKALAPVNGVTVTEAKVVFNWEALAEANDYNIQIATPDFETATQILTDSTLDLTTFSKSLTNGDYQWRVRAQNSVYQTKYTSQKFTVASSTIDISNKVVTISTPDDNATFTTSDTVNITWEAVEGAETYQIKIVTPNFDNPTATIKDQTISGTSLSISNLKKNSYRCRVKAKNAGFETNYTEIGFVVN
jgi:hypothetical protein